MSNNMKLYVLVSYGWSYMFWGLAIYLAFLSDVIVLLNENLVEALYSGDLLVKVMVISMVALFASYGPLVGALVINRVDKAIRPEFNKRVFLYRGVRIYLMVVCIFLLVGFIPAIPIWIIEGSTSTGFGQILIYLGTFFIIQLLSSGTEEFGWRGYMLPEFLKKDDAWSASFKTGLFWALWHAPIVIYIFYTQGMPVFAMLFSFIGFSAGIVAMSVVHCYFYLKTKSIMFSVYVHAVGNTIPLIAGLVVMNAYKVAVVSQLLIWVVVYFMIKKNPLMFQKKS